MADTWTRSVQATVPEEVADALAERAEEDNRSVSNYIATLLQAWYDTRAQHKGKKR